MIKSDSEQASIDVRFYLLVFLLAILLRVIFLAYIDTPIRFNKYPFFAGKLSNGEDIGQRLLDLSPVYLYTMTAVKKVFDIDWKYMTYVQSLMGAVICVLLMALGRRVFGKEIGIMAALLYAAYGNLIILESTLEPTVFVLLFNLLCLYFLYRSMEPGHPFKQIGLHVTLAGIFAGISIITKPNFILFLPIGAAWLLICPTGRQSFRKRIMYAFLFCGAGSLVVLPITLRNIIKFNDFVVVTADAGKVFYHGNGKGASALEGIALKNEGFIEEGKDEPDYAHVLFRKTASRLSGKNLSASGSSRFWIRKTMTDIITEPSAYFVRQAKKLFYFFNDYEMHYIASAYKEYKTSLHFPYIRYGIIATLGLFGMVISLGQFKRLFPVYGIVFVYLTSGLLFLVQSRYRTPAVPYLCLFAGCAANHMREMIRARRYKPVVYAFTWIFILFVVTHFVYRAEIINIDRWQTATKIYYQLGGKVSFRKGLYDTAIEELNRCIEIVPGFSPAYNVRGKSFAMVNELEAAENDFQTVIRLSPNVAEGYKNMGFLYLSGGNKKSAMPFLLKAQRMSPHDKKLNKTIDELK